MQLCNKFKGNRKTIAEVTNMTLLGYFYNAKILPESEVVRLCIYHIKNSPWFVLSKALIFIPIRSCIAKIKNVMAISRIMRIFPEPEVLSQKCTFSIKKQE